MPIDFTGKIASLSLKVIFKRKSKVCPGMIINCHTLPSTRILLTLVFLAQSRFTLLSASPISFASTNNSVRAAQVKNVKMDSTGILSEFSSVLPLPPCAEGNSSIAGECIEQESEPEWESEVAGIRVWQLVGIVLSVILAITIMICCCIRFRIPRTKQEIEADYVRKKLTRSFRKELAKISDKEMDEMDLKRALDRVHDVLNAVETDETQMEEKKIIYEKTDRGIGMKFNAMFQGMRVRFNKDEHMESNTMI